MTADDARAHLLVLATALGTTVRQLQEAGDADEQERATRRAALALAAPVIRAPYNPTGVLR